MRCKLEIGGDTFLDGLAWLPHNRAVILLQLRRIALACLACWALGPAMSLGAALHQLEHHFSEAEHDAPHEMTAAEISQILLHGHFHQDDPGDHSHDVVPVSVTASPVSSKSNRTTTLAMTGLGLELPTAERVWRFGPPSSPSSLDPPSPSSLCVLRL